MTPELLEDREVPVLASMGWADLRCWNDETLKKSRTKRPSLVSHLRPPQTCPARRTRLSLEHHRAKVAESVSKKRSTPAQRNAQFEKLRNEIRSSKNPLQSLNDFRTNSSSANLHALGGQFATHPAYSKLIWPAPFPKSLNQLSKTTYPYYLDFEKEVAWLSSLLMSHSDKLNDYVKAKVDVEHAFLCGEHGTIDESLKRVELSLGQSLWLSSHRINYLQLFSSSSLKSQYIKNLTNDPGVPVIVKQSVAWYSYKSGSDVSEGDVRRLLDTAAPLRYGVDYILHIMMGECPHVDAEIASQILSHTDVLPAVDRYNVLLSVLKLLSISNVDEKTRAIVDRYVSPLAAKVRDATLTRTLIFFGNQPQHLVLDPNLSKATDLYTLGQYADAATHATLETSVAAPIEHLHIALRSAAMVPNCEAAPTTAREGRKSIFTDIQVDLNAVINFQSDAMEARARLLKLTLTHSGAHWASALKLILDRQMNDERVFPPTPIQSLSALSVAVDQPILAFSLPGFSTRETYLDALAADPCVPTRTLTALRALLRGELSGLPDDTIPLSRARRLEAFSLARSKKWDAAATTLHEIASAVQSLDQKEAAVVLAHCLLNQERPLQTSQISARLFVSSRYYGTILPIAPIVLALMQRHNLPLTKSETRGDVAVAIMFDVYSRYVSSDRDAERADAYKDVLRKHAVKFASQLPDAAPETPKDQIVYFLRHICVPEVLDQSLALPTTRSVEDERAAILVKLSEMAGETERSDPGLKDELREIRTRQVVRDTTLRLDQSKIYVNTDGIRRVVDVTLRESWNRFHLMTIESLNEIEYSDLEKLVLNAVKDRMHVITINTPFSDRSALFRRMITELRDQFAFNKEFGLNSNLSTNIRHGYVLRELRGPLLGKSLITNRSADNDSYLSNQFWSSRISVEDDASRSALDDVLSNFSAKIDEIVERLNRDLLRIRSDNTPEGLFSYELNTYMLPALEAKWSKLGSYDEFIEAVFDSFWHSTERSLSHVRMTLDQDTLSAMNSALDELEIDLHRLGLDTKIPAITSAITMVRPDVRSAVDRVSSWFTLSGNNEYQDFDLEIPYQAGIQTIKTYYSDVTVRGSYKANKEIVLQGWCLPVFARLLFLLLDNAAEHSTGDSHELDVTVTAELDSGVLLLKVENIIHAGVDSMSVEKVIDEINGRYGQEGQNDLFGKERGTGFAKIWKLLNFDLQKDHFLRVYRVNQTFGVEILMSSTGLIAA